MNEATRRFHREKGRIKHLEKSFDFHTPPEMTIRCLHGWYSYSRMVRGSACVKCGKPEAECVAELGQ